MKTTVGGEGVGRDAGPIEHRTLEEIRALLAADGYAHVDAEAVRTAARKGALLWTTTRLTTTDQSRIDARPGCEPRGGAQGGGR